MSLANFDTVVYQCKDIEGKELKGSFQHFLTNGYIEKKYQMLTIKGENISIASLMCLLSEKN